MLLLSHSEFQFTQQVWFTLLSLVVFTLRIPTSDTLEKAYSIPLSLGVNNRQMGPPLARGPKSSHPVLQLEILEKIMYRIRPNFQHIYLGGRSWFHVSTLKLLENYFTIL